MDLLRADTDYPGAEATSGRVLAARHITADQSIPEVNTNNAGVNSTMLCYSMDHLPDFNSYMTALQVYAPVLWSLGAVATLSTSLVFLMNLRTVHQRRPGIFTSAAFVLAVYPVSSVCGLIAILVPRARLVTEAVSQQTVMVAMYQLYTILLAECGGAEQLIRRAEGDRLETRVLPCCCWPCCLIPRPQLHRSVLTTLKYLILQLPIVQAIMYSIALVLWTEDEGLYSDCFVYIQPFIVTSVLVGVWGTIMTVRAAEPAGCEPRRKFAVLQAALVIVKVHGGLTRLVPRLFVVPCLLPLHPQVIVNLVHNSILILEMFLLSLGAWYVYSGPADKLTYPVHQHAVVAVMEDAPTSIDKRRELEDGIQNNSFRTEDK